MISKEEHADLPIRRYEGEVCLVTTSQDVERARADFRHEKVVGFDTETRPSFRKGDVHLPCLVQAATARSVYLFQLRRMEVIPILHELLAETRIVKAGVGLDYDLRQLQQVFPFTVRSVLDLGTVARRNHLGQTGVRNLAGLLLRFLRRRHQAHLALVAADRQIGELFFRNHLIAVTNEGDDYG